MDKMTRIAKTRVNKRQVLEKVEPEIFETKKITLENFCGQKVCYTPKISTREELRKVLENEKKKYKPYMENYALEAKKYKQYIDINSFILDGKDNVTIPHYGGPVGYSKKVYETEFILEKIYPDKIYKINFDGVDYIATVYINGICAGKHEGFFSPFYFDISSCVKEGINTLKIEVENDYAYSGSDEHPEIGFGDKLYAFTGLGWDDSEIGWHHCPPGSGIYGKVNIEICNRIYISDLYVRPVAEESRAELWVEVVNSDYTKLLPEFSVSVFGKNFADTLVENVLFEAFTDNFENGGLLCEKGKGNNPLYLYKGVNIYRISVDIKNIRLWEPDTPWLYQAQVSVNVDGCVYDCSTCNFGMRSFYQDNQSEMKGMYYLNNQKIKLRGANTMGFEQWDVIRGDFNQLTEDILLAKICNMNFWRITQRPVQQEVYEYCDMLGLMVQTDLPLACVMRRTKFAEGVRQAEEMERLIRSHPSCISVSLINEPNANAFSQPHRHMLRFELENFFESCKSIILQSNPDRVIKYVDGDYDPPCDYLPDNHCYNFWYNGHAIDAGKMIKGYWCDVKPGWYCGCGEFGAEGMDFPEIMKEYYPKEWLSEPFDPKNIVRAQSGAFYEYFFNRPKSIEDWCRESQKHQANAVKIMTEAFRRNNRMVSFALHLFIDAWPSGWMKAVMDFKRNPKPAYFEYKNALEPVTLSLRTDRFTYYEDETASIETYLCNDTNEQIKYEIVYELSDSSGNVIKSASATVISKPMESVYVNSPSFNVELKKDREKYNLTAFLLSGGNVVTYKNEKIEFFKRNKSIPSDKNTVWICNLQQGEHKIAGETICVKPCPMNASHFASFAPYKDLTEHFEQDDFKMWYDKDVDVITPIVKNTFSAEGFTPILTGPSAMWGDSAPRGGEYVVAEKYYEDKRYIICTLELRCENPVAQRFIDYVNSRK